MNFAAHFRHDPGLSPTTVRVAPPLPRARGEAACCGASRPPFLPWFPMLPRAAP
jgi:hypothetical protein